MKQSLPLIFLLLACSLSTNAQNPVKSEIDAFASKTGAIATIDKATNSLNFLRFPTTNALKLAGATTQEKALSFVKQNAGLFSMQADKDSYLMRETKKDHYGMEHVIIQQYFQGVPVFDGILKFHFNGKDELSALNGNFIPVGKLNTIPVLTKQEAAEVAIKHVTSQKSDPLTAPLKVNKNALLVFQKGLAQGYHGTTHLVYEVEVRNDVDIREFLYIDAHTGALVEQFSGMHQIDRKVYETSVTPENLKWQESDGTTGSVFTNLDQWQQSEVVSSGHIYNLMKNAFGYISYNDGDAPMVTINNNPAISCPNANWNGSTANYCTGTASDDVVAHEWAHAYTENTSGLIYAWQAGALNEAYSDIWGETVDQLNGYMDDGESNALRTGCGSSQRWRIGEKTTSFGGPIRDMWDPTCNNNPGKVSDSQYWCSTSDAGGVHINSGIINHAYALLVDGGTYNGQTITGIGITKAAHIFWYAQYVYMTNTTDFAAQADLLEASLNALIGTNLPSLSTADDTGLSGQMITAADAIQLAKVIAAVEMRADNSCGFAALLQPVPPLCGGASSDHAFFYADFEAGLGSWTVSNSPSTGTWTARNWVLNTSAPNGRAGKVVYGVDFLGGNCGSNLQNGIISLISPEITIPEISVGPYNLAFDHYVSLESGFDGGNIAYKIGVGDWTSVPASAFTANPYNATLKTTAQLNTNPLQGQPAFTGADGGSVAGSWGQSRIDLSALGLLAGQTIQFRWDLGTDGCGGWDGWYIDDVRVYSCALPSVQFDLASSSINEGEAAIPNASPDECLKYVEKTVRVKINGIPSQPVTVTFNPPTGNAIQGLTSDYSISPNSFTLQAGSLFKEVKVRVYDDAYVEGNETFSLSYNLTNPPGGDAYADYMNQTHTVTIVDNDFLPGVVTSELLSANFNDNIMPPGWTVPGGGNYPSTWAVVQDANSLDRNGTPYLFINSDALGKVAMDKTVESASFNSLGMTAINLSFIEYFRVYTAGTAEEAFVDVWDGSAWHNVLYQTQATGTSGSWSLPFSRNISIPIAYANAAMKIRFRYVANWDWWWAIDNVRITGNGTTKIENGLTVNSATAYLGPNATAYFYDPSSKSLMVRIKNLSTHNYGCTSVTVDRAGADATAWGAYHITNKTFKVTPTNNNTFGKYEITLFYKGTELPNFNGPTIKSMGKTAGSIASGSAASTTFVSVQADGVFGSDYAYTSTFGTGFSGFALSDTPPPPPLPVNLIRFDGKHTGEGNLLSWATTQEVNNDYFAVEQALDGKNFREIARVAGNGNSSVTNLYQYVDTNYGQGISYYRLKQVDQDGQWANSKIISIDVGNTRALKFFPNPVQSILTMELPDASPKTVNVKVINGSGQEMLTRKGVKSTNGSLSLDFSKLPTGTYQIIVSGEKLSYTATVFKL